MSRVEIIGLTFLAGLAAALMLNGGKTSPTPDWPHAIGARR